MTQSKLDNKTFQLSGYDLVLHLYELFVGRTRNFGKQACFLMLRVLATAHRNKSFTLKHLDIE